MRPRLAPIEPDADLAMAGVGAGEHDVRRVGGRGGEHEPNATNTGDRSARPAHVIATGVGRAARRGPDPPPGHPRFERLERDRRLGLRDAVVPQPDGHLDAARIGGEQVRRAAADTS